jgi:hypothetical protein
MPRPCFSLACHKLFNGMPKIDLQTIAYLLISVVCAIVVSVVLSKSTPNCAVAALCIFVTVLCVQIAFLRRELSDLKGQVSGSKS